MKQRVEYVKCLLNRKKYYIKFKNYKTFRGIKVLYIQHQHINMVFEKYEHNSIVQSNFYSACVHIMKNV